jgi:hypothetical protein
MKIYVKLHIFWIYVVYNEMKNTNRSIMVSIQKKKILLTYMCVNTNTILEYNWEHCNWGHGENKLNFIAMMMMATLYSIHRLSWIVIVLSHWNKESTDKHVIPFLTHYPNSESTSFYSYSSRCLLSGEATNTNFTVWPEWASIPQFNTLMASKQTILEIQCSHHFVHKYCAK